MTRINTNVSSMNALKTLNRSNAALQQVLTRLSTGLRINTGKDDPAGLIASEVLRSDIVSTERAISNSIRANQVIATADSALGQVSNLLTDIRGLVTEAANEGAMSEDQIAANQLQIDSSLEALNRIAQTTSFQGRRLLDGSLDFVTTAGSISSIEDLQIDQAVFGSSSSIDVSVTISQAATQASVSSSGFSAAADAHATITFAAGAAVSGFADNAEFSVTGTSLSSDLSGVEISFQKTDLGGNPGNEKAVFNASAKTLVITIDNAGATTAANVVAAINNQTTEFHAVELVSGAIDPDNNNDMAVTATTDHDTITVTAENAGPDYNDVQIKVVTESDLGAANPKPVWDSTNNTLTLIIDDEDVTSVSDLTSAINTKLDGYWDASSTAANGTGTLDPTQADPDATSNTGSTGGRALLADLVLELSGADGSEVFSFDAGASINQLVAAFNLVSDSTGVTASRSGGTLTLKSAAYGSDAFVAADVISEGTGGTFQQKLSASRQAGSDIVATINGIEASGKGNTMSINTSMLDMSITVSDESTTPFNFSINSGGALFQLGPDVVTNQRARLGIQSVNTARLRGVTGRLFELASGESAALDTNTTKAAKIVDEVIDKVTSLRGRLGAFQKTTLDTNINTLNDTLETLTEAESTIRDADFAAESAALTRAQILVQSGVSVLAIANSNPQNVLALLR